MHQFPASQIIQRFFLNEKYVFNRSKECFQYFQESMPLLTVAVKTKVGPT